MNEHKEVQTLCHRVVITRYHLSATPPGHLIKPKWYNIY